MQCDIGRAWLFFSLPLLHADHAAQVCPQMWRRYLPNAQISFIEFDGACAEPW